MEDIFKEMLNKMPGYNQGKEGLIEGESPIVYHEIGETSKSHLIYGMVKDVSPTALVITYSDTQANKLYEDLSFFLGENIMYFPAQPTLYYFVDAHSPEISIERIKVLRALINRESKVIVASIEAIMKKLLPIERYKNYWHIFKVGQIIEIEELQNFLIQSGYERVEEVESPGQYNIRGGIVDIYPIISDLPFRIEFFDNEIDSIRSFDTLTQRSIDKYTDIEVPPTKELIFLEIDKKDNLVKYEKEFSKNIKNELYLSSMEYDFVSLMDYFPKDFIIFLDQPHRIKERFDSVSSELQEDFKGLLEKEEVIPSDFEVFFPYYDLTKRMNRERLCIFQTLIRRVDPFVPKKILSFVSYPTHPFHGKLSLLVEEIAHWKKKGYSIIILSDTYKKGELLLENLVEMGIEGVFIGNPEKALVGGEIIILKGGIQRGVEYPEIKTIILTEKEIFSSLQKKTKKTRRKTKRKIDPFVDLNIGDYVVHESYGIGKYLGLEKIEVDGIQRDYLNIKYARGDKLYIPTEQMDLIQPYIGGENTSVKLNRLGGNEWKRTKGKVKKAIEDMTEELLNLYAQRQTIKGFSFSKDSHWQREFGDGFPYEETPDQHQAIEEIKKDMEAPIVMDRLLCGDVGYGKTEVALRAAFKAVMDGKQVAFLVPTTILAQQHYNTMVERFSNFPISIDMLSRFKTGKQVKQTLLDIRSGMVDIVVGTHRMIQKDIKFKDLGLLIIDEEQRFGVSHKERLKNFKKNVDVLSLSATPIPRTLHMSLVGIRDMSIIEQPPEERYPVQTYVLEYNDKLIRDAILRELDRGGQIFYVYNRVENIERIAHNLADLVPEARITIGHGQMSENQLEDTMLSFIEKKYDVLVCTTIIESGLDIPNANTIIVVDGDKMGLSQLYQLRGRVGRSNRIAYAYITYEKNKILTEIAEKRLQAIKEFTEFGSGFKVAMRDLEIRGAGNLLGAEQHGHMAAIGYDLYCKLLEESINKKKGIPQKVKKEITIDLPVDAYIPNWYISKENVRIQIYKKMVAIETMEDFYDIQEEIEDRFGDLPIGVNNLLKVSYIKALAQRIKIYNINMKNNNVYLYFEKEDFITMEIIGELVKIYGKRIIINASEQPYISLRISRLVDKQLDDIKEVLEKITVLQVI